MSKNKRHNEPTNKSTFHQYINNEMSTNDAHNFEKQMLNDAFESDALDGLSTLSAEEAKSDLSLLRSKIGTQQKNSKKKIWLAAASLIITIGLSSLLWLLSPETAPIISENIKPAVEKKQQRTERKYQEAEPVATSIGSEDEIELDTDEIAIEVEQEVSVNKIEHSIEETPKTLESLNKFSLKKHDKIEANTSSRSKTTSNLESEIMKVDYGTLKGEEITATSGISKTSDLERPMVKSKQFDHAETPTMEANNGYTSLASYSQINNEPADKIALTSDSNFAKKSQIINSSIQNDFIDSTESTMMDLEEEYFELSEVVTITRSDEDYKRINEFIAAEPEVGLEAYIKEIEASLRYPKSGSGKNETVVVVMTISYSGDIKDIEVKRSPNEDYTIEVVRAIKNGSRWKPASNRGLPSEDTCKIKLQFNPDNK